MEKKQKKKKKWKEVRSALVMILLMVAMMSTATYAWFTMTSNPTVTGMQMVASSGTGLSVCNTVDGTYVNAIEIALDKNNMNLTTEEITALESDPAVLPSRLRKLVPVSLSTVDNTNPKAFQGPTYVNGLVTSLDGVDIADLTGQVAVYTYYIKSENGNVGVGLRVGNPDPSQESGVDAANQATAPGTFVRPIQNATDNATIAASGAIRIGLIVTEDANSDGTLDSPNSIDLSNMIIYEPNDNFEIAADATGITSANVELNGNNATYTNTIIDSDVSSTKEGTITDGGTVGGTDSDALFTVSETPKKVTMYVWLEGTDSQCVDQIKTDQLEAQIQFVGLDATTDNSNNLMN